MEIDKIKIDKDVLVTSGIELSTQEKQEYKLLGKYGRTPGLRIFSYNHIKDKLIEIKIISNKIAVFPSGPDSEVINEVAHERAEVDGRFEYFEALNERSARKRLEKYKAGKIKQLCNLRPAPNGCIRLW